MSQASRTTHVDPHTFDQLFPLTDEAAAQRINSLATVMDVKRIMSDLAGEGDSTAFRILACILDETQSFGTVPSNREVAFRCGVSHTAVAKALRRIKPRFSELYPAMEGPSSSAASSA